MVAYQATLDEFGPENLALTGASGGGILKLVLLLRAHAERVPVPAPTVFNTPSADLTHAGDTYSTHRRIDISYARRNLRAIREIHLAGVLAPYVSPVYADFTEGVPPT